MAEKDPEASVFSLIFDTDILIWFLRRRVSAAEFLGRVPLTERRISGITHLELLRGCRDKQVLGTVQDFVSDSFAEVIPLTEAVTDVARNLMERFALSRRPGTNDVLIAATALTRTEAVATANRKHFDFVPGLEIVLYRP